MKVIYRYGKNYRLLVQGIIKVIMKSDVVFVMSAQKRNGGN